IIFGIICSCRLNRREEIQQTANLFSTTLFEAFSKKRRDDDYEQAEDDHGAFSLNLFGNLSNAQCLYIWRIYYLCFLLCLGLGFWTGVFLGEQILMFVEQILMMILNRVHRDHYVAVLFNFPKEISF
ncbi:hypothetical protein ACJX0J_038455, partial [Zea mays]